MNRTKAAGSALVFLLAAACGGPASGPSESAAPEVPAAPDNPGPVTLDVTIIDGVVNPRGARLNVKVGQPVKLTVHSDVDEELHIHTDPEKTVPVKAGANQNVTFTVDEPGKVAVELHHLDVVVAEVLARK
jgi:plastocyanin